MSTDIPDPDEDPYAFSNGLMPYDLLADQPMPKYTVAQQTNGCWAVIGPDNEIVRTKCCNSTAPAAYERKSVAERKCAELNGGK